MAESWCSNAWSTLFALGLLAGCAGPAQMGGVELDQLRSKAEQGDANAQFQLGVAYDAGRGVARDHSEAAKWYRSAADQGLAVAQNSLGAMYQHGQGLPQNYDEARSWYQKAAAQGFGEAYANLGAIYDFGLGVPQDKRMAVEQYQAGAEKGSLTAMLNLGVSYWRGEGTQKDLIEAHKWLDLARFYTQRSPDMQLKWRVRGVLDEVKKDMTREQISKAEQLAREWDAKHRPR